MDSLYAGDAIHEHKIDLGLEESRKVYAVSFQFGDITIKDMNKNEKVT